MKKESQFMVGTNIYTRSELLIRRVLSALFVATAFITLNLGRAQAAVSECDPVWGSSSGIVTEQVDYVPTTSGAAGNLRTSLVDGSYIIRLSGWLYYSAHRVIQDAPVLIYNHGSGKEPGEPCAIAKFFTKNGFVVFVPLRRGHTANTPLRIPLNWKKIGSTGVYHEDYINNCKKDRNCTSCTAGSCPDGLSEVDYLRQQVADVADQISFMRNRAAVGKTAGGKLADPRRIAIAGHSYGGSLMVFANAELKDHGTAIDISGAEIAWDTNPHWKTILSATMNSAQQRPIYFLQTANARSLGPTEVLFSIASARKYFSQAAVFPPAPCFRNPCDTRDGPESRQAHITFVRRADQVALWAPSVIEFINRYPKN